MHFPRMDEHLACKVIFTGDFIRQPEQHSKKLRVTFEALKQDLLT